MPWTSKHRYARISARKARLLTDLIKGRSVNDALDVLRFTNKRASGMLAKVVRAAMADADAKEARVSDLYVSEARVDDGPMIKRFQPKDRGRAHPIMKRTSHIIVTLSDE